MNAHNKRTPLNSIPRPAEKVAQNVIALCAITGGYSALERHQFLCKLSRGKGREDVYAVLTELIRSWAADPDLHDSDAYVIEACRKICNVMGWTPTEVA